MLELALAALAFALAEVVLLFGAIPLVARRIRRWWRMPSAFAPPQRNVRAGCGHLTVAEHGTMPLYCGWCGSAGNRKSS